MITLRQATPNEVVEPHDVQHVIDNTSVVQVVLEKCQCGPIQGISDPSKIRQHLSNDPPEFGISEEGSFLLVKVTHVLRLTSQEEPTAAAITTLSVTHTAVFHVENDVTFSSAQLSAFVQTNVYFMVYPYVRQFFNVMTQEMGLPPVVLGYRKRDDWPEILSADTTSDLDEEDSFEEEDEDQSRITSVHVKVNQEVDAAGHDLIWNVEFSALNDYAKVLKAKTIPLDPSAAGKVQNMTIEALHDFLGSAYTFNEAQVVPDYLDGESECDVVVWDD